jgi:hypothetical protein
MFFTSTIRTGVLGILLLSGCSLGTWKKPGATQQDFRSDYAACETDAGHIGPLVRPLPFETCMHARGYETNGTACEIAGMQVQCRR